jgi:hypothetical protein
MNAHRTPEPIGSITALQVRHVAGRIKLRATGMKPAVLVYIDAGDIYAVNTEASAARWAENNRHIDIIGTYTRKASTAQIAEDLVFMRDRARAAA